MESKKIVHFRFDKNEHTYEFISNYYKSICSAVGDHYTVLISPFDISFEDENDIVLLIDGRGYTHQELEEVLDKAAMYDDLCQ